MPRRAKTKAAPLSGVDELHDVTAPYAGTAALYDGDPGSTARTVTPEATRRASLASRFEHLAQQGALAQAVKENRPEVDACRRILQKPLGKRSLDDIYTLDRLYQALSLATFADKGDYVFCEGDPGDKFYMVFTGSVEIVRHDDAAAESTNPLDAVLHLALLRPGATFGERAIVSDTDMRAASAIIATDATELVFVSRGLFKELLRESQEAEAGGSALSAHDKRFRSNKDIIRNIFVRHSAQRSEKDLKFAVEYLKSVKFFSRFSFEVRKQLCKAMRLISAVTNTVLFEEGQVGRSFYIIFSGSVEVSVHSTDRFGDVSDNVVSRLAEGESFGELALSEIDGIRRATVVCVDYCELLVLSREQYEPLIQRYQNEYHAQYAHLLKQNPYFIGPEWDDHTIEGMCSVMTEKYVPFQGEICKQGSRASELFVVTRGECRMVHEGKHPITHAPQLYELGRYGPNTIIGCAEASAGKFNDIYVRDYAVVAESPVKILVLSRFDIFHLMSPDARASLQRSAASSTRESIESRALKTVAWEKYRSKFLASVVGGADSNNSNSKRLTVSTSTPVLLQPPKSPQRTMQPPKSPQRTMQPLVAPCSLVLTAHHGGRLSGTRTGGGGATSTASTASLAPTSSSSTSPKSSPKKASSAIEHAAASRVAAAAGMATTPSGIDKRQRRHSDSLLPSLSETSADDSDPCRGSSSIGDTVDALRTSDPVRRSIDNEREAASPLCGRASTLGRSRTLTALDHHAHPKHKGSGVHSVVINKTAALSSSLADDDTLLHDPSITAGHNSSYSNSDAAAARLRTPKLLDRTPLIDPLSPVNAAAASTTNNKSLNAIWSPVHGVCQPFGLLGFLKETPLPPSTGGRVATANTVHASAAAAAAKTRSHGPSSAHSTTATGGSGSTRVPSASVDSHHHHAQQAQAPRAAVVVAFRVFGKFRDLNETLSMFRLICGVERSSPVAVGASNSSTSSQQHQDAGRFAIYKEDEITMVLENYYSVSDNEEVAVVSTGVGSDSQASDVASLPVSSSTVPSPSRQFRATDVLHGTGQRFACVSVVLATPATVIENVAVHVYQCFPTLQSAVRFARQMLTATLSVTALYVVPLFEWIPLASLDRFDAKSSDLEQALESVSDVNASSAYRSTWKARKDAVKKARALRM